MMARQNADAKNDANVLNGLRELANLGEDRVTVERFMCRWPQLTEMPESIAPGRESLPSSKYEHVFPKSLFLLRKDLREIWTCSPEANSALTALFLTSAPVTEASKTALPMPREFQGIALAPLERNNRF